MKYNLVISAEAERAQTYLTSLIEKKALAEIIKVSPKRTLKQNNYLYLLINAFAMHFGLTSDKAKNIYKALNQDLYFRKIKVNDKVFLDIRSSRDLSKEDMAKSIDRFREFSAEEGYPLPLATNQEWIRELGNAVEQASYYL